MDKEIDLTPVSINEAAAILGVSPYTIRAWLGQRKLGFLKLSRSVRIPRSEITRFMERAFVPPRVERPH
jgi:excisionase family DNA binding protein